MLGQQHLIPSVKDGKAIFENIEQLLGMCCVSFALEGSQTSDNLHVIVQMRFCCVNLILKKVDLVSISRHRSSIDTEAAPLTS